MKIYGYLRFSYLGMSDTKLSDRLGDEYDAYFKELYDPVRMARRFHFFEKLCLPGLRHQSDPDFTVIVIASEVMPQPYKNRLEAAVAGIPQIQIRYSNNPKVLHALRPQLKQFVDGASGNTLHFRLDDDDVLGVDAIADLKAMGARAEPETILTLPNGYMLFASGGKPYLLPFFHEFHSVGWTRVNGPGDYRSPFKFGHRAAGRRFPSMVDPRKISFSYTMHAESDTADWNAGYIKKLLAKKPKPANAAGLKSLEQTMQQAFPGIGLVGIRDAILNAPGQHGAEKAAE